MSCPEIAAANFFPMAPDPLVAGRTHDPVVVPVVSGPLAHDGEILRRALTEARVCVTLDADFHALLVTGGERGPSVIRIRAHSDEFGP